MNDDVSAIRSTTASHRGALPARLSIERKLPLIIGGLLLAVIVAVSAAAYVEVRSTSLRLASERLTNVTLQFRDLFQQSGAQLRGQAIGTAAKPTLAEFARTRNPRLRDRARGELEYGGTPAQREQFVASELRDGNTVLLSTDTVAHRVDTIATPMLASEIAHQDSGMVGRYRLLRDTIIYPVAAAVRGVPNVYVVHWRRIAGSRRARQQITQLIGSDASMFLGNSDGSLWTDLERPVSTEVFTPSAVPKTQSYVRGTGKDRARYLASSATIPGTPWIVAIDFPYSRVFAPGDIFVGRITLIGLAALALGLLAAWLVSRRLTAPLAQLTGAADAIAAGDYSHAVPVARSDEVGRLAQAFAIMAREVHAARENLERKVDERTRDLNTTLTQLSDAQESLVRREKLAMLGQLASGVGHELRNPLGVMTNAVYYLKMVLGESPDTVKEYLDILQQQITLSEKIVGDLLDFARLKPPQRQPSSLLEVTQTQIGRLGAANGPGMHIETEFPPNLPPVYVDQIQIGQIVLNLLTNAIQAMDGSGRINIRAHAENGRVHYDVADTGPGVAPENLEKIFEPLFTTKARGIGLGLAVSRTLARANEGELKVSSVPGQGATFRLTLPRGDEAAGGNEV